MSKSQFDSVSQTGSYKASITTNLVISEAHKESLRQFYKPYNIVFTDSEIVPDHSYAAARRSIELKILIDHAKETSKYLQNKILVTGANVTAILHYILQNDCEYHLCCPTLDARDVARHDQHTLKISNMNLSEDQLSKVLSCVCQHRCEDCKALADVGVFCHSIYDMTPTQIADIMENHGLFSAIGALIFSTEILVRDKGVIPIINMHYTKNKSNDSIYMRFKNDNSNGYIHKLSNYI